MRTRDENGRNSWTPVPDGAWVVEEGELLLITPLLALNIPQITSDGGR
jgi:hypothetical protein